MSLIRESFVATKNWFSSTNWMPVIFFPCLLSFPNLYLFLHSISISNFSFPWYNFIRFKSFTRENYLISTVDFYKAFKVANDQMRRFRVEAHSSDHIIRLEPVDDFSISHVPDSDHLIKTPSHTNVFGLKQLQVRYS